MALEYYLARNIPRHIAVRWAQRDQIIDEHSDTSSITSSDTEEAEPFQFFGPPRYIQFNHNDPFLLLALRHERLALAYLDIINTILALRLNPARTIRIVRLVRLIEIILNPNPDIIIIQIRARRPRIF